MTDSMSAAALDKASRIEAAMMRIHDEPAREPGSTIDPLAGAKLAAALDVESSDDGGLGADVERHVAAAAAAAAEEAPGIPDTATSDESRRLLELNGFNAIREEILAVAQSVANLPLAAIDAAIDYNRAAAARLEVDPNPLAGQALRTADRELTFLRAVRTFRRDFGELQDRIAARDRIEAP